MTVGLAVECQNLSKAFGATQALDDVSLTFACGSIHGLAGPNGSGKSTLLKILVGLYSPDAGCVSIDGEPRVMGGPMHARSLGIELVPQEFALVPALSVWENVVLGNEPRQRQQIDVRSARSETRRHLERLEISVDVNSLVGELNPAEQRLVMVAEELHRQARLLIADEPTAGLPAAQSAAVTGALRSIAQQGVTVIFVSHHLEEMTELCDEATVLVDGRVRSRLGQREVHTASLVAALSGQTTV